MTQNQSWDAQTIKAASSIDAPTTKPGPARHLDTGRLQRAFEAVPPHAQDGWVDEHLGLDGIPDDDTDLPRGGAPYLPCPAGVVARAVSLARIGPGDVVVDVGSGVGRVLALIHLLTGAGTIGLEVQRHLVDAAQTMAERHRLTRVRTIQGDAEDTVPLMVTGTVFFFYCPFSGPKLERVVDAIEALATLRPLRLCVVDMPLPRRPWIVPDATNDEQSSLLTATTTRHGTLASAIDDFNAVTRGSFFGNVDVGPGA